MAALALMSAAGLITACGAAPAAPAGSGGSYPMTIENCGRQVTLPAKPERLYVIGGEAGTIVEAAGGAASVAVFSPLVGEPLGKAEGAFSQATNTPIKSSKDISREVIIAAEPDLLVTYGLNEFAPEDLAAAGIPTIILSGYCGGFGAGQSEVQDPLEGVYQDVETLGRVLGTDETARAAAAELRSRVAAIRDGARQTPPSNSKAAGVFVVSGDSPLGAYGSRSMLHQQMEAVGLTNVFESTSERYFEPNVEALIAAQPERIIALHEPGDTTEEQARLAVNGRPELRSLPAVSSDAVHVLSFFYSGHGTLAVDGLERLAELLRDR
ncbi:ABC transporter substrate-binding protein [Microlunatus parietis]|uniref:Iron complex transport system substrate-binding protein n=1 Tax=Microlunatus parietis TaxID=682979 RepID=A0A7Y9L770_9ACTN|nr:ABC transporter substrate-binding protein [Microlunatus parietis]NYE69464.1 iron complex transport system substrate-binding protein [Microlunatus parietis]